MTGFRFLHSIDSQKPDGVDTKLVKGRVCQDETPLAFAELVLTLRRAVVWYFDLGALDMKGTKFPRIC